MHILVVSADPDVPRLLGTLLPGPSWHLAAVRGAREALRVLVDAPPDVVVADAKLPEIAALFGMVRRVPGGNETLVVMLGHGTSTPREADHVVNSSGAMLEILDLVRADERRRAEGRPRPRAASAPPSSERPTLPGAESGAPLSDETSTRVERVYLGFAEPSARRDTRDSEAPTRPGLAEGGPPEALPSPRAGLLPSGEATTLPGTSAGAAEPPPAPAPRPRPAPHALDSGALQKRLKTELRAVEGGNPWSVLALARGADLATIVHAAARMRTRYDDLMGHGDPAIRHLAERMRVAVDLAHTRLLEDLGTASAVAAVAAARPHDRDDRWEAADPLEAGHALLRDSRWEAADAWFESARDRLPGDPKVLAALGWARYHNPRLDRETREGDGIAFLELAAQFDPRFADAQLRLAHIHLGRGDLPRARERARAATRAAPDNTDAAQFLREVEQRLAGNGGR